MVSVLTFLSKLNADADLHAALKRIYAKLEPQAINKRKYRLGQEEETRLERRSKIAAWHYRDYLHTLVPIQWRFLPTPRHLIDSHCRDVPSLRALIDMKEEPTLKQWKEAMAQIPAELSAHLVSQLAVLQQAMPDLSDIPSSFDFALLSNGSDAFVLDDISARFASLDLARAVFMRGERDWTTGGDNPHAWDMMSTSTIVQRPVLSPRGSAAVCAVANLIKKNYTSVTATEMDVACGDSWMQCTCTGKPGADRTFFKGWRGFVSVSSFEFLLRLMTIRSIIAYDKHLAATRSTNQS